jgi:hypothetical protein
MTRRAITSAAIGAAALFVTQVARSGDGDAETQFKYGLAEMLAGRYATGCPALETSYRLDPRAGALFTLAECDRKWGKAASALTHYEQYLALCDRMTPDQRAAQRERPAIATEELAALQAAASQPPIGRRADSTPALSPYESIGRRAGSTPALSPYESIGRRADSTPALSPYESIETKPAPEPATAQTVSPAPIAAPPQAPVPSPDNRSRRTWTYAVGAVGVAGLVVAGTTGMLSIAKRSTASSDCNAMGVCTSQQGVDAGNAARELANVATAAWVVGGIALGAAIVLWLTEPGTQSRNVAAPVGTW